MTAPLTEDQKNVLDLVFAGEWSMSMAIRWARRTGQTEFAEFLRSV